MKIYARQVAPEYQESPLFLNEFFPDNIILDGNRNYCSHTTPEYEHIDRYLDEMCCFWLNTAVKFTVEEMLHDFGFCRSDGKR